jgi:outer membrane protein assembly factor BamB
MSILRISSRTRILTGTALATWLAAGQVANGDWPRYMGPAADGVARNETINRAWPAEGPPLLWRVEMGEGFGGAAIAAGKVYVLDRADEQDKLRVFDLLTGREEWSHAYAAPGRVGYPGSRSTPTVDGERLYTVGAFGHLSCFDIPRRQLLWSKQLPLELGAQAGGWGFAQSPLVHNNMLIVFVQSRQHGVAALDKQTGAVLWKSEPVGAPDSYTSPLLATIGGVEQIIAFQKSTLAGLNPANGKILWKYSDYPVTRTIPQPVLAGDGRIFLTSGYGRGCAMVQVTRNGDRFQVKELFRDKRSGSTVPSALFYDGHIYTNAHDVGAGLQCLSADGEVKWQTQSSPSFEMGSLLIADGLLFAMDGRRGLVRLLEARPHRYRELAQFQALGGGKIWGPLAISNGKLVVRDQRQMKCFDVGAR